MWREEGAAELYFYSPVEQIDGFCDRDNYSCNYKYGHGINKG